MSGSIGQGSMNVLGKANSKKQINKKIVLIVDTVLLLFTNFEKNDPHLNGRLRGLAIGALASPMDCKICGFGFFSRALGAS